ALREELLFALQVSLDRLADLDAADITLVDIPARLTSLQNRAVGELDGILIVVDLRDGEAAILVESARFNVEVGSKLQPLDLALDLSRSRADLHLNPRNRRLLRDFDAFEI